MLLIRSALGIHLSESCDLPFLRGTNRIKYCSTSEGAKGQTTCSRGGTDSSSMDPSGEYFFSDYDAIFQIVQDLRLVLLFWLKRFGQA